MPGAGEFGQVAEQEAFQYCGVDVAFSADGRGVSQLFRDRLDHIDDVPLGVGLRLPMQFLQRRERQRTRCPGPVILGGEIRAGKALQVGVDIG